MMITIHGFPAKTKYQDVKLLIKQECSINDFILDNLINDTDGTKKVRIGLTDNTEGYKVMKCLDGYRMAGNFVLKAIPIGKAAASLPPQPSGFDSHPPYQSQPRNDYPNAPRNDYMNQPNDYNNQGSHGTGPPLTHGGMHGSTGVHGSVGSHGPAGSHPRPPQGGPHGGPHASGGPQGVDSMNRPSPWVAGGGNSNQWNTPMVSQVPQNSFGYTSPQAGVNPSYGQQQNHPRPSFNQGRPADQGYGYTPKSNVPEVVPANPHPVQKEEQEPEGPKTPRKDGDPPCPSSADGNLDEESHVPNDSEEQPTKQTEPPETKKKTKSKKALKREQGKLRDLSKLNAAKRRRFYFWKKQGKTFMEARELCELPVKKVPEYAAAKADKKRRAQELARRNMSPEEQARGIKLDRMKASAPGAPPLPKLSGMPPRVRLIDEVEMPQEKIEMLEDKILELMEAETVENRPRFVSIRVPQGTLQLGCGNEQTIEWLQNHLADLQLWDGAQVKIVNHADLPKRVIAVATLGDPDLEETEIFEMLKSKNKGIDFSEWKIASLKREPPDSLTVVFSLDYPSADKVSERNNFVYIGTKKVKLRFKYTRSQARTQTPGQSLEPERQTNVPKNQRGMPYKGQRGMPYKGQRGMPYKGQRGMPPKGQRGMPPTGRGGNNYRWQRGKPPTGQGGNPYKWYRSTAPVNQTDMPPMGMQHMDPMSMGYMGPTNIGYMGPTDPPYMGPIDKGYMGPIGSGCPMDSGYMGRRGMSHPEVNFVTGFFAQPPVLSQWANYSGGYPRPQARGGKNHNKKRRSGGPSNNGGNYNNNFS